MPKIPMTEAQVESWSAQYAGDRTDIVYDGQHLLVPDALGPGVLAIDTTLPALRFQLKALAASKRYAVEVGGISIDGVKIDTSRESQNMIAGAHAYVIASGATSVQFKAASGFVTLTAAEITAIALSVGSHVQACFAVEMDLDFRIDAGTIVDVDAVSGAAWPSNS